MANTFLLPLTAKLQSQHRDELLEHTQVHLVQPVFVCSLSIESDLVGCSSIEPEIVEVQLVESPSLETLSSGLSPQFQKVSLQGTRHNMEDSDQYIADYIQGVGKVTSVGVYDGHNGDYAAKFLGKNGYLTLKNFLEKEVSSPNDHDDIIRAFRLTQDELQENMPTSSGATVILALTILQTGFTFVLCLGDGSFSISDKETGTIFNGPVRIVDFATNSDQTIIRDFTNDIHQVKGKVSLKPEAVKPESLKIDNNDGIFELYEGPDEITMREWEIWCRTQSCNPSGMLKLPSFHSNAWRMKSIHPTRTSGNEETIHQGEIYIMKSNLKTSRLLFYCDGVEDNDAASDEQIAKYAANFSLANEDFMKNHVLIPVVNSVVSNFKTPSHIKDLQQIPPPHECDFLSKIRWVNETVNLSLAHILDKDWKRGARQAWEFFSQINISTGPATAEELGYLCVARLSGDNVSLVKLEF